jgi:hypothetical protein
MWLPVQDDTLPDDPLQAITFHIVKPTVVAIFRFTYLSETSFIWDTFECTFTNVAHVNVPLPCSLIFQSCRNVVLLLEPVVTDLLGPLVRDKLFGPLVIRSSWRARHAHHTLKVSCQRECSVFIREWPTLELLGPYAVRVP